MVIRSSIHNIAQRVQKARKKSADTGAILMYHCVTDPYTDPWELNVTPENFREHLAVMKKVGTPISLTELVAQRRAGKVVDNAIVVTFDDGYVNNLERAKPLLEEADVPATVFVSTAYTGKNREFWWDELDRYLLQPQALPTELTLTHGDETKRWNLGPAAAEWAPTPPQPGNNHPRLAFYYDVWEWLRLADHSDRFALIEQVASWAHGTPEIRAVLRPMTEEELCTLVDGGIVDIGGHTITHPLLPSRPTSDQRDEIQGGKAALEEILSRPVTTFSYPFNQHTRQTRAIAKDAGFDGACGGGEHTVWRGSDPMNLPRFAVLDWDGETFERKLEQFLNKHV